MLAYSLKIITKINKFIVKKSFGRFVDPLPPLLPRLQLGECRLFTHGPCCYSIYEERGEQNNQASSENTHTHTHTALTSFIINGQRGGKSWRNIFDKAYRLFQSRKIKKTAALDAL